MSEEHPITPLMAQYIEIKQANPDSLLFYRMGDFYELFFGDAEEASRALGIALTKRGKHNGQDIPMAGVPIHTADDYLQRLIKLGFRVSVCEQIEDPKEAKKRGAKSVVKRDVVRLVTPGTLTEETILDPASNNYLLSVAHLKSMEGFALAWIELSTGEFKVMESDSSRLAADIARLEPSEILVPETLYHNAEWETLWQAYKAVTPLTRDYYETSLAEKRLLDYYELATLEGFGTLSRLEMVAGACLLAYLERTQRGKKAPLSPPVRENSSALMLIDAATRANLEITKKLTGEKSGSLLETLNRTVTASGSRLFTSRLAMPLAVAKEINYRLEAVDFMIQNSILRDELRIFLKKAPDMARALSRLYLQRGGPRDLFALKLGLEACGLITARLAKENLQGEFIETQHTLSHAPLYVASALDHALSSDLPLHKRDGGFIGVGVDKALDEARALRDESRQVIASLQNDYANQCEVKALKIKHNNVLGYFIEVNQQQGERLLSPPLNADFIHRQTLAGVMRFSTTSLSALEAKIAGAADVALTIELAHFARLEALVLGEATSIRNAAESLAQIDVIASNAVLALESNYVKPKIDESLTFEIKQGRHPVVEGAIKRDTPFIANDCSLSNGGLWLMTGPNMAGKSTFLRQNALIALIAQTGSYVPAAFAHIGIVDRLFSRVGAADDLARGRSTFMVEMVETAAILNQATPRSLVILDEIGRGTATFDGLSIAWAAVEYLHEHNQSRALFATHFHELTALAARLKRLHCATMRVQEWQNEVVFLHEVISGVAQGSYGLQVAKLAGLPPSVIARARSVLTELEANERQTSSKKIIDDLPLFSTKLLEPIKKDPALEFLDRLHPDDLSPREAQEMLYKLKALRK